MCERRADRRSVDDRAPSGSDPSLRTCLYLLFNINQMEGFYFDVSVICFQRKFSGLIWQWHAQYTVHTDSDDTFVQLHWICHYAGHEIVVGRGGGYRTLLILNNCTRWTWVFSFTPQLLFSRGKYHARCVPLIWTFWGIVSSLVPIENGNKVSLSPRP